MNQGSVAFQQALLRNASYDLQARGTALAAIDMMNKGVTYASSLLAQLWRANEALQNNPDSAALGRRTMLAKRAYEGRVNVELARTAAAYALLAEQEGAKAKALESTLARSAPSARREVTVQDLKNTGLRRDAFLDAAKIAQAAYAAIPPLPESIASRAESLMDQSRNLRLGFRPENQSTRQSVFNTEDSRIAAGVSQVGLRGLGDGSVALGNEWWIQFLRAVEVGEQTAASASMAAADEAVRNAAGGAVDTTSAAQAIKAQLPVDALTGSSSSASTAAGSSFPWGLAAVAGLAAFVYYNRSKET